MTKLVGVDVSKYNGYPDWAKAKQSGVQFAILRLGSGYGGGYIDKTFDYNYRECKRVGIPVGCYIASYCNIEKEIELTKQAIKNKQFEYPIYFDIEDFSIKNRGFTKSQITNLTVKFLSSLEKLGYYVGLYTNRAFLNSHFDWDKIKNYDVWIAHWTRYANYEGVYPMHQFTNSMRWYGIPSTGEGGVDTNWCFVDYPGLMKELGLNGYKKQKEEVKGLSKMEEEKLLDEIKQTVVTYEDRDYDKAVKIAKKHRAVLVPAELNMDFGKMKRSKDTIIGIGDKTGKIEGENFGITGYCDYLVSADKVDEFLKDRSKFLRRK